MKDTRTQKLINKIKKCTLCNDLPLGPKPVFQIYSESKILIVGQAPGVKAHETETPWNDASGDRLRDWMGINRDIFYKEKSISLFPMGLCYPGKGVQGDLPPRKECYPEWHHQVISAMPHLELIILVGNYAQNAYLKTERKKTLTDRVHSFKDYIPKHFPLPHPSPLNNIWLSKNRWFENDVVPELKILIHQILKK